MPENDRPILVSDPDGSQPAGITGNSPPPGGSRRLLHITSIYTLVDDPVSLSPHQLMEQRIKVEKISDVEFEVRYGLRGPLSGNLVAVWSSPE